RAGGVSGPRFVPPTPWAALRIIRTFSRNGQRDPGKRISINVRITRRIATLLLQRPFRNASLSEISVLQMAHPLKERDIPLDNRVEPVVGVGPIVWNPREILGHQRRMVELLFLVRAQVGLGTRHPEDIAMQKHLPVAQWAAVG